MALALEGLCILLVEDDPIIGLDLRQSFEEAGAVVLGPAPDVAGALVLLEQSPVDVGVLDVSIIGGDSLPIADLLSQRGVTFLFHTCHRGGLRNRYPTVPIIDKPSRSSELIKAVQALKARPA
jgi:DNA-binding NarL/FixJ family response regulator